LQKNPYIVGNDTPQNWGTPSITQAELLQPLLEDLDDVQTELAARVFLFCELYLTPTQYRRWMSYFTLGSIKEVAAAEGVSATAIAKSINGTRPGESSASRLKSPVVKLREIIYADLVVQELLAKIAAIQVQINDIAQNTY
jgi:hypothetical protein